MAATLANKGINPVTKERAVNSSYIKDILSVMYNFAGEWADQIGIPAKSGVCGGIIAI